jgi:uncharacterized protein (TIGR02118 family)
MPRPLPTLILWCALLALAACSAPPPPAAAAPGVGWVLVVLYNQPKDTAAFEKYYAETHVPLFFSHAQEIGFTRVDIIKFAPGADGKPAPVYREADVRWDSKDAMDKGLATAGFKTSAADLPKFATGGFTVLIGRKTN